MSEPIAEKYELAEIEASIGDEIQEYGRQISLYGDPHTIAKLRDMRDEANATDDDVENHYNAVLKRVRELKQIADRLERIAYCLKHEID